MRNTFDRTSAGVVTIGGSMRDGGEGPAKAAPAWERWLKAGCVLAIAGILVGGLARVLLYLLVLTEIGHDPTTALAAWVEPTRSVLAQLDGALRPGFVLALALVVVRLISRSLGSSDRLRLVGALVLGLIALAVRAAGAHLGQPLAGTAAAAAVASFLPFIVLRGAVARWVAGMLAIVFAGLSAANQVAMRHDPGNGLVLSITASVPLTAAQILLALWGTVATLILVGWPTSGGSVEQALRADAVS